MGCSICGEEIYAKGLCRGHYMKQRRYGDAEAEIAMGAPQSPMRAYLERTGEWDAMLVDTGERSRKKFLKALNQLRDTLGRLFDYEECRAGTLEGDALAVAKALALSDGVFNFALLEREAERIRASRSPKKFEQWLPDRKCRQPNS